MPRRPRTAYSAEIVDGVLAITDNSNAHPLARTVTNAVETVLAEMVTAYGEALPAAIIYCDSEGVWDGIAHHKGDFIAFYPLRVSRRECAIAMAKARKATDARFINFEME